MRKIPECGFSAARAAMNDSGVSLGLVSNNSFRASTTLASGLVESASTATAAATLSRCSSRSGSAATTLASATGPGALVEPPAFGTGMFVTGMFETAVARELVGMSKRMCAGAVSALGASVSNAKAPTIAECSPRASDAAARAGSLNEATAPLAEQW